MHSNKHSHDSNKPQSSGMPRSAMMQGPLPFYEWVRKTRYDMITSYFIDKTLPKEKIFLSFLSHHPTWVSMDASGPHASVMNIYLIPKPEYLEETLNAFMTHIDSYSGNDYVYAEEGFNLLIKYLYCPEAKNRIDETLLGSLALERGKTYHNHQINNQVLLHYYQPPVTAYLLKGNVEIIDDLVAQKLNLYQQFLCASHHIHVKPDKNQWNNYPSYLLRVNHIEHKSIIPPQMALKIRDALAYLSIAKPNQKP